MEKRDECVSKEAHIDKPRNKKKFIKVTSIDGLSRIWIYPNDIVSVDNDAGAFTFKTVNDYCLNVPTLAVEQLSSFDRTCLALGPFNNNPEIFETTDESLVSVSELTNILGKRVVDLGVDFYDRPTKQSISKSLPVYAFNRESVSVVLIHFRPESATASISIHFKENIQLTFKLMDVNDMEDGIDSVFEYLAK